MKQYRFLSLLISILFLTGCIKNNPEPAWIKIEKWTLEANPQLNLEEGALSQNFTDAWVYVDEKLMGVFELPAKIPVLMTGNKRIVVYPAIRNIGVSDSKKIYPFCEGYELYTDLNSGETVTVNPITRYASNVDFYFKEEFEDVGFSIETDNNVSNTTIVRTTNPDKVKYGSGCGFISLNSSSDSLWLGFTNKQLVLPKQGAELYLELDYMTTNQLMTGVLAINSNGVTQNPHVFLPASANGQEVWKKVYLDLKEIVSNSTSAEYFEMYFRAIIDAGESDGEIYIDNLKIVHF